MKRTRYRNISEYFDPLFTVCASCISSDRIPARGNILCNAQVVFEVV
jgi:hypothetical protein